MQGLHNTNTHIDATTQLSKLNNAGINTSAPDDDDPDPELDLEPEPEPERELEPESGDLGLNGEPFEKVL